MYHFLAGRGNDLNLIVFIIQYSRYFVPSFDWSRRHDLTADCCERTMLVMRNTDKVAANNALIMRNFPNKLQRHTD